MGGRGGVKVDFKTLSKARWPKGRVLSSGTFYGRELIKQTVFCFAVLRDGYSLSV